MILIHESEFLLVYSSRNYASTVYRARLLSIAAWNVSTRQDELFCYLYWNQRCVLYSGDGVLMNKLTVSHGDIHLPQQDVVFLVVYSIIPALRVVFCSLWLCYVSYKIHWYTFTGYPVLLPLHRGNHMTATMSSLRHRNKAQEGLNHVYYLWNGVYRLGWNVCKCTLTRETGTRCLQLCSLIQWWCILILSVQQNRS